MRWLAVIPCTATTVVAPDGFHSPPRSRPPSTAALIDRYELLTAQSTPVHGVGGSGDHGRIRTDQPADQGRDFLRLDQTLDSVMHQHDRFQHLRLRKSVKSGLVGDLLLHQRRPDVAGVDAVARHAVRTAL